MNKKRNRKTVRTLVFIVLAVFLFALIIFSLSKVNFMDVIGFIPSLFEKEDEGFVSGHSERIKELIELLESNEGGYESAGLDNASVIAMLSAAPTEDSYYHTYSVTYTSGEDTTIKNVFVTKASEAWTVVVKESNSKQSTVSFDGKEYVVRDDISGEEKHFSKDSGMSFEGQNYLTPVSDIKALLSEYEALAGTDRTAGVVDAKAEIVRTQTDNIVLVSFKYADRDHFEEYMIHLDYGVVISATASLNGEVYYKVTTNVFDPDYKVN